MARITKPVEERRQEIIDTAKELFFENGFDKTQVADISRKMNVAQGLIYHYFKSKTEILYAIIDALAEEKVRAMEKALSETKASTLDCLHIIFSSKPEKKNYEKMFGSISDDQNIIVEYCRKKMTVSLMPLLTQLIERGNLDGSWHCKYPGETAAFILQGVGGILGLSPSHQDEEQKKSAFSDIIFRVLGTHS